MGLLRVDVEGLQQAKSALEKLERLRGVEDGLKAAAIHLKGKFAAYPARKRPTRKAVYGKTFKSVKQQRFVFAAMKRGDIPYVRGMSRRSEALGRRWATERRHGGLEQVVGNNASYAEYVMGDERQSQYMKAVGWEKMSDIVKREERTLHEIVNRYAKRDV